MKKTIKSLIQKYKETGVGVLIPSLFLFLFSSVFVSLSFSFIKNDNVFFAHCEKINEIANKDKSDKISYTFETSKDSSLNGIKSYLNRCRMNNNSSISAAYCSTICFLKNDYIINNEYNDDEINVAWCNDLGYISKTLVEHSLYYGAFTTFDLHRCVVNEHTFNDYNITGSYGNGPCYISQEAADKILLKDTRFGSYSDLIGHKTISIKDSDGSTFNFVVSNVFRKNDIYDIFRESVPNDFIILASSSPIVTNNLSSSFSVSVLPNQVLSIYKYVSSTVIGDELSIENFNIGHLIKNRIIRYDDSELMIDLLKNKKDVKVSFVPFIFFSISSLATFAAIIVIKKKKINKQPINCRFFLLELILICLFPPFFMTFIRSILKQSIILNSAFNSITMMSYVAILSAFFMLFVAIFYNYLFVTANKRNDYYELNI